MQRALALIVFLAGCGFAAWGQTAIEYSTLSSSSAAGIAKSGSSLSSTLGSVGKRFENAMGSSSTAAPAEAVRTSLETSIRSNRQQLDQQAHDQGCANVRISSVPKDATLFIDSQAVAATPADLCVPLGKHVLELRARGFRSWSQEVTLAAGQAVSLAPTLSQEKQSKEYQRTVSVTF